MKKRNIVLISIIVFAFVVALPLISSQEITKTVKPPVKGAKSSSTQFFLANMKKGEIKELRINLKEVPVNKIFFRAKKNYMGDMQIHLKRIYNFPDKKFPRISDAHSYFEINTVNFDPAKFENITIQFDIEKQWLMVRGLTQNQVSLYRYSQGNWTELDTKFTSSQATIFFYSAVTPDFSYFAIAKKGENQIQNYTVQQNETIEDIPEDEFVINDDVPEKQASIIEEIFSAENTEELKNKWQDTLKQWSILAIITLVFYIASKKITRKRRN